MSSGGFETTLFSGQTTNGTSDTVECNENSWVQFDVDSTSFVGTVTFRGKLANSSKWKAVACIDRADMETWASAYASAGDKSLLLPVRGLEQLHAVVHGYASGTISVYSRQVKAGF